MTVAESAAALPRSAGAGGLVARDGRVLVDSAEAARLLGYANRESFTGIVRAAPHGRWPAPVACRIRWHTLLWDLAELQAAAEPPADPDPAPDGDVIACRECGRTFRTLSGSHLAVHGLTADQYRARHRLPPDAPLAVPRAPNPAAENFGAVSAAAHAQDRADRACAAGYPDWAAAIEATRTMTLSAAAARLGCTLSTVTFWRARLGPARDPDPAGDRARAIATHIAASAARREDRARAAGYPDWATAIEDTRTLSAVAAGARLGCNRSTITEWRARLAGAGEQPRSRTPVPAALRP